jgi:ankyrin repeat protein
MRTTLLMAAASKGQEAMVRMLLQRGASVNLQSPGGGTARQAVPRRSHRPQPYLNHRPQIRKRKDKIVGFHDASRLATLHNSAILSYLSPR